MTAERRLCACGCGERVVGVASRYKFSHWQRLYNKTVRRRVRAVDKHPRWRGGLQSDNRRALGQFAYNRDGKYESIHRARVEAAVGHKIGRDVTVFDVLGNIVVGTFAYGMLIRRRTRAATEAGDANKRWCGVCGTWDDESAMTVRAMRRNSESTHHRECATFYEALRSSGRTMLKGAAYRSAALAWKAAKDAERAERSNKRRYNRDWRASAFHEGR